MNRVNLNTCFGQGGGLCIHVAKDEWAHRTCGRSFHFYVILSLLPSPLRPVPVRVLSKRRLQQSLDTVDRLPLNTVILPGRPGQLSPALSAQSTSSTCSNFVIFVRFIFILLNVNHMPGDTLTVKIVLLVYF